MPFDVGGGRLALESPLSPSALAFASGTFSRTCFGASSSSLAWAWLGSVSSAAHATPANTRRRTRVDGDRDIRWFFLQQECDPPGSTRNVACAAFAIYVLIRSFPEGFGVMEIRSIGLINRSDRIQDGGHGTPSDADPRCSRDRNGLVVRDRRRHRPNAG